MQEISFNEKSYQTAFGSADINKTPCGYCKFWQHKGYLTSPMLKKHKCIQKNCKYFTGNPNSEAFVMQKNKINTKKAHKKNRKRYLCGEITREEYENLTLQIGRLNI